MINQKLDHKKRSKTLQVETNYLGSQLIKPTSMHPEQSQQYTCEKANKTQTQISSSQVYPHQNNKHENSIKEDCVDICGFKKMKMMIKVELQKLTYKEKLNNIQAIIWKCKQLCDNYGFFILTCMMFQYNPHSDIKFSLWIHPNKRSLKPLHPIKKPTYFECEVEFISNLKRIFREMFPTIDLGRGKTFANLAYHINDLKKNLILRSKKNIGSDLSVEDFNDQKQFYSTITKEYKNNLCTSLKTMPVAYRHLQNFQNQRNIQDNKNQQIVQKQNQFKTHKAQKATVSTLVESIRSNNSLKQKIKKATLGIKEETKFSKNIKNSGSDLINMRINRQYFNSRKNSLESPLQQLAKKAQQEQIIKSEQKKTQRTKKSQINNRRSRINAKMATSGQIQSDLNNLFGSDDFMGQNVYYQGLGEVKPGRNSVLSQVMQEFQQLLF